MRFAKIVIVQVFIFIPYNGHQMPDTQKTPSVHFGFHMLQAVTAMTGQGNALGQCPLALLDFPNMGDYRRIYLYCLIKRHPIT
jgi:hypothetical protein